MTPKEFLIKYYAFAKTLNTTVPYLLILAQAALESGWGKSVKGNNFFGIKAGKFWAGEKQLLITREVHNNPNVKYPMIISIEPLNNGKYMYKVKDWFRIYLTPAESFLDHSNLLLANWKDCITSDPIETITKIQSSKRKYATDPDYVSKITKIVERIKAYEMV